MNFILTALLSLLLVSPVYTGGGKSKPKKTAVTVEGSFSSKRGVMHEISCYCFDSGFVTTDAGDKVAVCFEKNEMEAARKNSEKFSCSRIKVTGTYVTKTISPEDGACSSGSMRYLKVASFKCME